METKNNLEELLIALIVLFNFGIVARWIADFIGCLDNDDKDPKNITKHYLKIGVLANGISGIVYFISTYFR